MVRDYEAEIPVFSKFLRIVYYTARKTKGKGLIMAVSDSDSEEELMPQDSYLTDSEPSQEPPTSK